MYKYLWKCKRDEIFVLFDNIVVSILSEPEADTDNEVLLPLGTYDSF